MTLAFAQVLHLGNARRAGPVLAPGLALANRAAVGAVLLVGGLQLLAAFFDPLARVLRIAPLSGREWLLVVTLGALPAAAGQAMKGLRRLRARPERPAPRPQ